MKKTSNFECGECGEIYPTWMGRCSACGQFGTIKKQEMEVTHVSRSSKAELISLANLTSIKVQNSERLQTNISELDRVLGGGLVGGEIVLISGEPGVGKSTLLLSLLKTLRVLYIAGEESPSQVKNRSQRMGLTENNASYISDIVDIDRICTTLEKEHEKFQIVIIDSIQTVYTNDVPSTSGSMAQIRECLGRLSTVAKKLHLPVFIVGHITKDGDIAGPKMLEHMVDCVLYFEGEKSSPHRVLRAHKNRFGSTDEIGVFLMGEKGLTEQSDPLGFLDQTIVAPGSAIIGIEEGKRIFFYEVQALVVPTGLPMPRRVVVGLDFNRAQLLLAIIKKYLGINLDTYDIYISVVGGVKVNSPLADLGIVAAVVGGVKNKSYGAKTVFSGELGLMGEVRKSYSADHVAKDAKRLGYDLKAISKVSDLR